MDTKCGKYLLVFLAHLIGVTVTVKLAGCCCSCLSVGSYICLIELAMCVAIALITFGFTKQLYLNEHIHPDKKAVVITGCDSGFGHGLAKRLDAKGFRVFACCLFPDGDGAKVLRENCSRKLQILELDVTKDESVKKVLDHVKENLGEDSLWALVNNAGIAKGYIVDLSPIEAFLDCLEVNTIGLVRMTKAFLPLLKKSKGRVVNLTSLAGRQIVPFAAPYIMSKYAAVAFNDCLRIELQYWGIRVISIEPDFFRTNIVDEKRVLADFETTIASNPEEVRSTYGEGYFRKIKECLKYIYYVTSSEIYRVVDSIDSAVTDQYPSAIYRPSGSILCKITFFVLKYLCSPMESLAFKAMAYMTGHPKPKDA